MTIENEFINLDARGTLIKVPRDIINRPDVMKALSKYKKNNDTYYLAYESSIVHKFIDYLHGRNVNMSEIADIVNSLTNDKNDATSTMNIVYKIEIIDNINKPNNCGVHNMYKRNINIIYQGEYKINDYFIYVEVTGSAGTCDDPDEVKSIHINSCNNNCGSLIEKACKELDICQCRLSNITFQIIITNLTKNIIGVNLRKLYYTPPVSDAILLYRTVCVKLRDYLCENENILQDVSKRNDICTALFCIIHNQYKYLYQ